jgi:hypothetical protein
MVSSLKLVLRHFIIRLVAHMDSLLFSPGSPASLAGFQQSLALDLTKHNNRDKDSKAQKHSMIFINQSNEIIHQHCTARCM